MLSCFLNHLADEERELAALLLASWWQVVVSVLFHFLTVSLVNLHCAMWHFLVIPTYLFFQKFVDIHNQKLIFVYL